MNHMTIYRCLALAAPMLVVAAAEGKFAPLSLSSLCGGADLIIIGSITEVRAETFRVDVVQTITGSLDSAPLEVCKFVDWTCARRWAPYEIGQRVLLFLTRGAPDKPNAWQIMGAGGEGEMLVENDIVLPRVRASVALVGENNNVYYSDKPQRVPLDALLLALRDHRRCFKFITHSELPGAFGVRHTCSIEDVDALRRRSGLHAFLFDETTSLARALVDRWDDGLREARAALERGDLLQAARHAKWAAVFVESIATSDARYLPTLREYADLLRRAGHRVEAQAVELRIKTFVDPATGDVPPKP